LPSRWARRLCWPHLALFDRGIAVSPAAARFARAAWSRPLALIPNGVDTNTFKPLGPAKCASARGRRGARLLFVGHFRDPRKGLATLIDAFGRLRQRGAEVTLDVVGDGDPRTLGALPQGIKFHGPVASDSALAEHYHRCDVFVAPSLGMESFGIVL